ncbi:DUF1190 domain-containing protein [Roseococcus sp. YIM B11640]|uniref:DUF1190 domain-containing protein n=1 Tax=Roseococcus sp. YIM B11640 TaxID=3133973 RepID=UPI003C7E9932
MRRSSAIRLTLLAASAVALQACGEDVDTTDFVVTDVASCVARYGSDAQAECEATFRQAEQQHLATAPRYASVAACEQATGGSCQASPGNQPADKALLSTGAAVAIPVLAGVMIGRMMNNGQGRVVSPLYAGAPPPECPPGVSPAPPGCPAPRSSSSSSSSGSRSSYYYSGSNYVGSTDSAVERGRSSAFHATPAAASGIASGSSLGRGSSSTVSRGGFGSSARGYSSSSS